MNTAVGHEAEQVHVPAALERGDERRILEERAVCDRTVDAHQILVEAPARADRQVADLRGPHLAGRQPGSLARRLQGRVRELAPQTVEDRWVRQLDRVPGPRGHTAPAVE